MFERMKAVFCVDQEDGIPICADCKVQIGEGEDHCLNCALYEAEEEIRVLQKNVAVARYAYLEDLINETKERMDAHRVSED